MVKFDYSLIKTYKYWHTVRMRELILELHGAVVQFCDTIEALPIDSVYLCKFHLHYQGTRVLLYVAQSSLSIAFANYWIVCIIINFDQAYM